MELDGEAAPEGGGRAMSVFHVLSINGPDSPPLWGGALVFVRGDVKEAGGGKPRFSKENNGAEGGTPGGRDLAEVGIREGP